MSFDHRHALTGIVGTIAKVVGLHATRRYGWPEFAGRMLERSMELVTIEEGAVVSVAVKGRLDSVGAELLKSRSRFPASAGK